MRGIDKIASFSARRATLVVAIAFVVSLAGVALALTLDPGRDTAAAGGGGKSAAATRDLRKKFGGDPVVVLVRGRLTGMLLTEDVARLLSLEGCISGNVPRGAKPAAPVCREFARRKPVQVVYGPGTFINEAANQVLDRINFDRGREATEADRAAREARRVGRRRGLSEAQREQFAQEARRIVTATFAQRALQLAVRFGLNSVPALNNPEFVLQLVFEPSLGAEFPKPRFAYLFPHSDAAVIQARLRPGLSGDERREAVEMIRSAVGAKPFDLKFGDYVVSGTPVVAEGVAEGLSDKAPALIAALLLFVAVALVLTFRGRPVALPLLLGAGATAVTLGGAALLGASFSAGVAAALAVLGALAAGWTLQLQVNRAAVPAVLFAALAAALAFAALLLSPVSMTRSLGALVAVGMLVACGFGLTAGVAVIEGRDELARRFAPAGRLTAALGRWIARMLAALRMTARRIGTRTPRRAPRRPRARRLAGPRRRIAAGVRRSGDAIGALPATGMRFVHGARRAARERPGRILRIALLLAIAGGVLATQIDITSDQRRLLPSGSLESRDLDSVELETGTPGDVNLIVRSNRLLDPEVVRWMSSYQRRVLRQNGFRPDRPCREADLCPALSLTNLFGQGRQTARQIRAAVDALPRYFSQNVITSDRRTANIAFRLGAMSPEEQGRVVDRLRAELHPPAGVDAELAGPVVAAADGEDEIATSLWLVTLAALLAVGLLVGAVSRSTEAALLALIPLTLAVGWAFLVLWALPVDVDFLTAGLGAIVVGVAAGPVVMAVRHRGGRSLPHDALAFGAVAVAGFLALLFTDIPSLRDLGVTGAVALPLCGLGLAVSVPATLAWADRRGGLRVPRTRAELAGAGRAVAASTRRGGAAVLRGGRRVVTGIRRGIPRAGRRVRALASRR